MVALKTPAQLAELVGYGFVGAALLVGREEGGWNNEWKINKKKLWD